MTTVCDILACLAARVKYGSHPWTFGSSTAYSIRMDTSVLPTDHLPYLQRRPFIFRCSTHIFPVDELAVLTELGNWLEALTGGTIEPTNDEQRHFLLVDREEASPTTLVERAWLRLKGRREYEEEEREPRPTTSKEDYGIVEWDPDRCWW